MTRPLQSAAFLVPLLLLAPRAAADPPPLSESEIDARLAELHRVRDRERSEQQPSSGSRLDRERSAAYATLAKRQLTRVAAGEWLTTPAAPRQTPIDLRDEVMLGMLQGDPPPDPTPGEDAQPGADEGFQTKDQSGNDPRGFDNKFMPYYRHTNLKNGIEVDEFVLFGMFAFSPRFAMTYEWPMARKFDVSDLDAFQTFQSTGIPPESVPGQAQGSTFNSTGAPSNLLLSTDLDGEGDEVGMGDLGLRFFVMPEQLQWTFMEDKNFSIMPVLEMTLPTATEDILGGEAFVLSPGFVLVFDLPFRDPPFGLGLIAMMNFFDFDAFKDSGRDSITRFRGRWFYMQPLSKPTPEFSVLDLSGLYIMTELQPIYDFMESDFDLWIAPEFGKILQPGFVLYAKPGFGISPDPEDRDWTIEIGSRIFF